MYSRRDEIKKIASQYDDDLQKARRVFLEEASFAAINKRDVEFRIKSSVAAHFKVPYRSVVFCGSAHLGFSPHKGSDFVAGESDLDLAIISMDAFQAAWRLLNDATRSFSDLTVFSRFENPKGVADEIKDMMAKRGLLHLSKMPSAPGFDESRAWLENLHKKYRAMFGAINLSFYMNEYAYCWKQNSAIQSILGQRIAKAEK